MTRARKVLYVYKCPECGHRGEQRLEGDSHDGEAVELLILRRAGRARMGWGHHVRYAEVNRR